MLIEQHNFQNPKPLEPTEIKTISSEVSGRNYRFIKVVAKNIGNLPTWHLGAPFKGKAWLFVDEISVN